MSLQQVFFKNHMRENFGMGFLYITLSFLDMK